VQFFSIFNTISGPDLNGPVKPDAVLDSIRDLPEWWDNESN
jgi:hypothetical protein